MPPKSEKSVDRPHYHAFAKRFADSLKNHPPVSDCQVLVLLTDHNFPADRIDIVVEMQHEALKDYLAKRHEVREVTQKDIDRYMSSFRSSIKQAAAEIFADIQKESIHVTTTIIK
jgi:hypothetical protein